MIKRFKELNANKSRNLSANGKRRADARNFGKTVFSACNRSETCFQVVMLCSIICANVASRRVVHLYSARL